MLPHSMLRKRNSLVLVFIITLDGDGAGALYVRKKRERLTFWDYENCGWCWRKRWEDNLQHCLRVSTWSHETWSQRGKNSCSQWKSRVNWCPHGVVGIGLFVLLVIIEACAWRGMEGDIKGKWFLPFCMMDMLGAQRAGCQRVMRREELLRLRKFWSIYSHWCRVGQLRVYLSAYRLSLKTR